MSEWHLFWRPRAAFAPAGAADSGGSDSGGSDSGGSDSGGSAADGNSGASASVATPGVPIGLSPTRPGNGVPIRGDRWPPADIDPNGVAHLHGKVFEERSWSDFYGAIACLADFVQVNTNPASGNGWHAIALDDWHNADVDDELKQLHDIKEYRPALMAEALAQKSRLVLYWQTMLAFNGATHPATTQLMEVCLRVAQLAVMYYKRVNARPRPSQLSPWLMPPVAVPGHASYPSGHSTEAHLQANCLNDIFATATASGKANYRASDLAAVTRLADRIARNREVLGLHYPSDTKAGVTLAAALMPMLQATTSIRQLMDRAQGEWAAVLGPAPAWPPP